MGDEPLKRVSPSYQIFMLVLSVFSLVVLLLELIFRGDAEVARVLDRADSFVCLFFFGDFVYSLVKAPRKLHYLATWGWIDLLSSIPVLEAARWGRLARIARLMRVLRALRASRMLWRILRYQRGQSVALAAALFAFFLIVGSSAAILRVEEVPTANIRTADDAVWWAFTTITTVGYGDRYPVTEAGRLIAALLMTTGVGLFSAFSGALAAWFLEAGGEDTDAQVATLIAEVAALRKAIEASGLRPPEPAAEAKPPGSVRPDA
jgi:voltage-gated potassium channel